MRLLIVEDEYYTRQGIIEDLDLKPIGFDDVQQELHGREIATIRRISAKPIREIVLRAG